MNQHSVLPPASLAPYHLAYPYLLSSGRVPVLDPRRFKAKNMLEWTSWKRACKDMFCNNPAYFPDNASKVNWSLTHLETGPCDAVEKNFKGRQSCAIMWEAFCSLLLDYVRLPETQQSAARLGFAEYKQREGQSMKDYTEASAHLAAQLPEDYPQVEQAITYLTGLKLSIRAYLPVHQILRTFNEAADMVLHIETNAELLGTGPAFTDGPARRLEDNCSRSPSPRKREGSPLQGDREHDSEVDRQQQRGHRS